MYVFPGGVTTHAIMTMVDSKKGSLTNRAQCAKEHIKNDLQTGVQLAVPTAGLIGAGYIKTKMPTSKAASVLAKGFSAIGKGLGKIANKISPKAAEKIMKNPAKYGAAGVIAATGLYILGKLFNYENTKGRIDQKYEDAAKIEATTKNVVLM